MISRTTMIAGGGAMVAGVVALLAWSASASGATAASSSTSTGAGTLAFTAGRRYEIDLEIPPNTLAVGSVPTATAIQTAFDAISSGAFKIVSVGVTLPGTAATGSGFTFYVIADCLRTLTVSQTALLEGSPAGTTITATDNGLTPASSSTSSTSSTTTTSTSTTSTTATPPPATTLVEGAPPAPGSGVNQWITSVVLGADGNVLASYWPGDTIVVSPPSGGTWASSGSNAGVPTSGSAPYTFLASSVLADMSFAWSFGGTAYVTVVHFRPGRTWQAVTTWGPLDTVRISISGAGWGAMGTAISTAAAELAALTAMSAQLSATLSATAIAAITPAQGAFDLLTTGPWSASLGIIANASAILAPAPTLNVWVAQNTVIPAAVATSYSAVGVALPSDWPTDPSGIIRAEFQVQGIAERSAASVPFPVLAWKRIT